MSNNFIQRVVYNIDGKDIVIELPKSITMTIEEEKRVKEKVLDLLPNYQRLKESE